MSKEKFTPIDVSYNGPAVLIDNTIRNADWIKTLSFDMPGIETEEELRTYVEGKGVSWEHWKTLPVYEGWLKTQAEKKAKNGN